MTATDLSKQQALEADSRGIQSINFTANSDQDGDARIVFILEEGEKTILP